MTEPNAFIADDDEEMDNYSLRFASHGLIGVSIIDGRSLAAPIRQLGSSNFC